ncbi:MAG TPA: hypothetical protein VK787_06975 [Puia sp.]|jgi:hypothetical protein|nr:hypothetical protein [Puia sp.]
MSSPLEASTKQIFHCLAEMPGWCEILLKNRPGAYSEFLQWLLQKDFFEIEKRIVIRNIAKEFGADPAKITKWIVLIYEDILDLNEEMPALFKAGAISHELWFNNREQFAVVNMGLMVTPRLHERFDFWFIKAKVGRNYFYVKEIEHDVRRGEHTIRVHLVGGFANRYREQLVDRAYFEKLIDFKTHRNPSAWDLDDKLRKWYK